MQPVVHYLGEELKTEISRTPVPIPKDLVLELSAHVEQFSTTWIMCDEAGRQMGPWQLQRAFRAARSAVEGLPEGFRFHGPTPLLRLPVDLLRARCEGRAGTAQACLRQDDFGHLRALVAGL